jgi:small-conductance mechanosensitive channel
MLNKEGPAMENGFTDMYINIQNGIITYFSSIDWGSIIVAAVKIIAIMIASRIIVKIGSKAIQRFIIEKNHFSQRFDERRTKTIGRLVKNVLSYTVYFMAFLLILTQMNFQIGPLLAGAGVLGLAIGFGAQSLVRDVITGFFIIFEDQFAVGDVIQTGNFRGTVEEIGLRITKIKNWTGEIHIIPNGSIMEVTNFSVNNSIAVTDVSIAYEADVDMATRVIQETAAEVYKSNDDIVSEPEVLGVQTLGASEVVIRVTTECKPMTHYGVGREMNAAMKKALDKVGIEIPYPRLVTFRREEA